MSNNFEHKPAFPTNEGDTYDGMELLDYFAAQAMQKLLVEHHGKNPIKLIVATAYEIANAMIEERKKYVR